MHHGDYANLSYIQQFHMQIFGVEPVKRGLQACGAFTLNKSRMSNTLWVLTLLAVYSTGVASQKDIGSCNITYFIDGTFKCQRTMVLNLKQDLNATCSAEYSEHKACLETHAGSCLSSSSFVVPFVTTLLQMMTFHCGDLTINPSDINPLVLNTIGCQADVFGETVECWDDFRTRFNANRSDPTLCREYALAKKCVIRLTKSGCRIAPYLSRDHHNPFCTNDTDPVSISDSVNPEVTCNKTVLYQKAFDCEKPLVDYFAELDATKNQCNDQLKKFENCLEANFSGCFVPPDDEGTMRDLKTAMTGVMKGKRFFCDPVTLDTSKLREQVNNVINICGSDYYEKANTCGKEMRLQFAEKRTTSTSVCRDYKEAKECFDEEQKELCEFGKEVEEINKSGDVHNPFCNSDAKSKSGASNSCLSIIQHAVFCLVISLFAL